MEKKFILAIDQGTSSTKTLIFNEQGEAIARGSVPLKTNYFGDGFVEQHPEDIYQNVLQSVKACVADFKTKGGDLSQVVSCGISNQRETFLMWDEKGKSLHPAVVWQCKRSVQVCDELQAAGLEDKIKRQTGLIIDPYFSGTKVIWLYQHHPEIRHAIDKGGAYFGTVDTWLLYRLTGGKSYLTDYTNASRTMFFNLETLNWDKSLMKELGLTGLNLPGVQASSSDFGSTNFVGIFPEKVAIQTMIGDSHAAAFGEGCFHPGTAKATLGTGCSILMNIGNELKPAGKGMVATICWSTESEVAYAQEGVIVSCGATIEWLKNELGILNSAAEAEQMALSVPDNGGVYLIPAFSGLGAPYWDMNRKAEIGGMSFSSNKNHIVRAALETIPFQIKDVVMAMEEDTGVALSELRLNGGITSNTFVMRSLANLLSQAILCMQQPDVSALGAAYLAGLKAGIFKDIKHLEQLSNHQEVQKVNDNSMVESYKRWKMAIQVSK